MKEKTKIIITGATGFIGTALCKKLEEIKKYSIVKVTRSRDKNEYYKVKNFKQTPPGDILIHLAENPDRSKANKLGEAELKHSTEVLDILLQKGFQFVIYCSSAVLYGDKGDVPYSEDSPVSATDVYSQLKLTNEEKVIKSGGAVVRLANVIGERMANNNILSDILNQLSESAALVVKNSGPVRDFVWVDDVGDGIVDIVMKQRSGIYNIGSGEGISIHDLASLVIKVAGQQKREIHSISLPDSRSYNVVDVSKMRKDLGWMPTTSIEGSIGMLLKYRQQL